VVLAAVGLQNDSSWQSAAEVRPFWTDLYGAEVHILLNGLEWFYERVAPQDRTARSSVRQRGC